jgi:hypothetical protein
MREFDNECLVPDPTSKAPHPHAVLPADTDHAGECYTAHAVLEITCADRQKRRTMELRRYFFTDWSAGIITAVYIKNITPGNGRNLDHLFYNNRVGKPAGLWFQSLVYPECGVYFQWR